MRISFHPAARLEEREAYRYYSSERGSLGLRFREQLVACIRRIERNPEQFPLVTETCRRALMEQFPYQVFFAVDLNDVLILAIAHGKREPLYWLYRI